MSTRGTVYVAINGVQAGVTAAAEAKQDLLNHIGQLLQELAQDASIEQLDRLSQSHGLAFEMRAGEIASVVFS